MVAGKMVILVMSAVAAIAGFVSWWRMSAASEPPEEERGPPHRAATPEPPRGVEVAAATDDDADQPLALAADDDEVDLAAWRQSLEDVPPESSDPLDERTDPFARTPSSAGETDVSHQATLPGADDRVVTPVPRTLSDEERTAMQVEDLLSGLVSAYPRVRADPLLGVFSADRSDDGLVVRRPYRDPAPVSVTWHIVAHEGVSMALARLTVGDHRQPVVVVLGPGLPSHRRVLRAVLDSGETHIEQAWVDRAGSWWTIAEDRVPLDPESRAAVARALTEVPPALTGSPRHHEAVTAVRWSGLDEVAGWLEPWKQRAARGEPLAVEALLGCNIPDEVAAAVSWLAQVEPARLAELQACVVERAAWTAEPLASLVERQDRTPQLVRVFQAVLDRVRDPALVSRVLARPGLAAAVGGEELAACVTSAHLPELESLLAHNRAQVRVHGLVPLAALACDPSVPPRVRTKAHVRLSDLAEKDRAKQVRDRASQLLGLSALSLLESIGRDGRGESRRNAS